MTLRLLCLPLFAALLLAGCDRVDPDSPLGKRKAIYQAMLDTKEDLGGMLRGRIPFDGTAFTSGRQARRAVAPTLAALSGGKGKAERRA